MANYEYIAKSSTGREVSGILSADSEAAAVRMLSDKQLFPVKLKSQAGGGAGVWSWGSGVPQRKVGMYYAQLADLQRAGVPMLRAMMTLERATTHERLRGVIRQVREAVAGGEHLADALSKEPRIFPPLHVAMIRAGERGGFLEEVLSNLAAFLERQDELRSKLVGVLVYPALLTMFGLSVMLAMLLFLVPMFKPMFEGFTLPLPSQLLFAMSDAVILRWPVLVLVMLVVSSGGVSLFRSEKGRQWIEAMQMKLPVVGSAIKMSAVTRFCRILGTLLANGVPLLASLSISKDAAGNLMLTRAIEQAARNVREGQPLHQPLRECGLFPLEVIEMIAVAEESNQMEKVLVTIADTVERRTTQQVDLAVRLIEPLVLVLIAGGVLFMALGLLYPIFTMSQTLR